MFRSPKDICFSEKEIVNTNSVPSYRCDLCGEGPWSTELDVDIHRKSAHQYELLKALKDDSVAMCSICLRVQTNEKSLREHILVNHFHCPPKATMINREIFICDYCHRLFFNKQLLIAHIYHWHTKKTPDFNIKYECPKCSKLIRAKSSWFHLLYHGCFNVGTCPICLKCFEKNADMLEHVKTHPYTFRCNICNYETTKECHLNNHLSKHNKVIEFPPKEDAAKFFLPEEMVPSLNNRMTHIFKGIPLANEVKICVLCKTLAFTEEQMHVHIFAAHVPHEERQSKTNRCHCGEEFFNKVLLKQHIFKMKGNHRVWEDAPPLPVNEPNNDDNEIVNVYQIYGISEDVMNEIVITGLPNPIETEENEHQYEQECQEMQT